MEKDKEIDITVLVPVYNEEEALEVFFDELFSYMNDHFKNEFEVIVVSDGSTDNSLSILKRLSHQIRLVVNAYNLGYGASLKKGLRLSRGRLVAIIDADGTYPISCFAELFSYTKDYDMVVGNRDDQNDILAKRFAKSMLKFFASMLSGKKIPDLNSGMRIFKRSVAMEFFHLFPSGFSFTSTITLACFANDYTVKYVPIPYSTRIGKSNIRPGHFLDFLGLIIKLFIYFKPLKMLSPFGIIALFVGVIKGVRDVSVTGQVGTLAAILILFGVQIFILALVSEVIVKRSSPATDYE